MIKSLDKQKIQAHNKEKKIEKYKKTGTKCLRRQFRHHTGTTWKSYEKNHCVAFFLRQILPCYVSWILNIDPNKIFDTSFVCMQHV